MNVDIVTDKLSSSKFRRIGFCFSVVAIIFSTTIFGAGGVIAQESSDSDPGNYLAHLAAANSALRLNEAAEAQRWLGEIPRAARGWEWELLNARSDSSSRTLTTGPWSPVRLDLSPDGRRLAVAGADGFVRIYQADNFELEKEWKVSEQSLYAARFHPRENQVAVCSRDGQLSIWEIEAGKKLWSQKSGGEGLADLAFRPDGQELLFCSWYRGPQTVLGIVSTWDPQTGEQKWKTDFGVKPIVAARYSPDGKQFAVGNWNAEIGLWSVDKMGEPQVFDFSDRRQYSAIDDLAFSPDSRQLAAATKNGTPRVWTLDGSAPPIDFAGHSNAVFSVAFSNDGKSLLSGGSDGVLSVWSIEQRIQTHRFQGHQNRIGSIVVDSRTSIVTTASADKSIRQWNLNQARRFEDPEAGKFAYGLVVADAGHAIVTAGQSPTAVSVWAADGSKALRHFPGTDGTVNYLAGDGANWVVGGNWNGDVVIWDLQTGEVVKRMGNKEIGGMQQCALSSDRKWIAVATNKKQVAIWNAQTGELAKTIPFPSDCWGLDFSPDNSALAIGDGQGTVHWVSVDNWETQWTCHTAAAQIKALRVSPKGDWLAVGSEGGLLAIIDISKRQLRHEVQAHSERIWTLDISPSGDRIVTGSADLKVKTWDPVSGVSLLTISDFAQPIYNVRFSPDGNTLYVNSLGSQIHMLNIKATGLGEGSKN